MPALVRRSFDWSGPQSAAHCSWATLNIDRQWLANSQSIELSSVNWHLHCSQAKSGKECDEATLQKFRNMKLCRAWHRRVELCQWASYSFMLRSHPESHLVEVPLETVASPWADRHRERLSTTRHWPIDKSQPHQKRKSTSWTSCARNVPKLDSKNVAHFSLQFDVAQNLVMLPQASKSSPS